MCFDEGIKLPNEFINVKDYFDDNPTYDYRRTLRINKKRKKRINPVSIVLSALIVLLMASLPMMSIWFANQGEVSFAQAFMPASVFMLTGLLFFLVFLLITRRPFFSGIYSAFAIYLLADFQIVRKLVSQVIQKPAEPYVSALVGIIILIGVFILLYKLTKEVWLSYATRIAAITLAGVMALSFIMGNPAFAASSSQEPPELETPVAVVVPTPTIVPTATPDPTPSPTPEATPEEKLAVSSTNISADTVLYADPKLESNQMPNVYCFILDEYGPPHITDKYYGFDNSLFVEFLQDNRFNSSATSLCNIAETSEATGELHRLEPFLKKISKSKARSYRKKNSPLYESFRSLGYTTYSNCAWPKMFPIDQLKNNMDALVELSTLDRKPPLVEEPEKPQGTDEPVNTPVPTVTPAPTPRRDMYQDFETVEVETDWRDVFFTSFTENDETMYDLAVQMSVLSLFLEKMSDRGMLDDEDDIPEIDEPLQTPEVMPSLNPDPSISDTPAATPSTEPYDGEDYEDGEDDDYENVDHGEAAPLDTDAASDPVSYDELLPIPKKLSVHARDMYDVLKRLDGLQAKGFAQPTFLFNYIRQPHVPFMFDKYGKALPTNVKYWWKNPNYYLGQLKFITTHMMHVIDILLETDPDCVIIIQSDHGIRYRQLVFDTPAEKDEKDQYYVLNFVYYRGQKLDIEGLSPVNTYRTVLTKLGLDMPLVQDPRALEFRGQKYGIPDDDPRLRNINNN